MNEKFMSVAGKIATNRYLVALRDAFLYASGVTIIAGFIIMINSVFLDPNAWSLIWGADTGGLGLGQLLYGSQAAFEASGLFTGLQTSQSFLNIIMEGTLNIYAVLVVVALAANLGKQFFEDEEDYTMTIIYSVAAFLMSLPWLVSIEESTGVVTSISMMDSSYLGTAGVFTAIITTTLSVFIFHFALDKKWTIKMPAGVPPAVARSFSTMIPGLLVLLTFMCIKGIMGMFTPMYAELFGFEGVLTLPSFIIYTIQAPLLGMSQSWFFAEVMVIGQNILQFFGIHGNSVFGPIINSTWSVLGIENMTGGSEHIITDLFFNFSTVTISFALAPLGAMYIACKQPHLRKLSKLATVPAIFNISEPIAYGLPIVLNPYLLVPYLIVPSAVFWLSYVATVSGIIPVVTNAVPWTTPIFFSGILATESIMGGLWQLLMLAMGIAIYVPFIKAYDRSLANKAKGEASNE